MVVCTAFLLDYDTQILHSLKTYIVNEEPRVDCISLKLLMIHLSLDIPDFIDMFS